MRAKEPIKEAKTKEAVLLFRYCAQAFDPKVLSLSLINQHQVFLPVFLARFRKFFILANEHQMIGFSPRFLIEFRRFFINQALDQTPGFLSLFSHRV